MWIFFAFTIMLLLYGAYAITTLPTDEEAEREPLGLTAVDFPEANMHFEYRTLPAYVYPECPEGEVVTCWKLAWRDRIKILFTGILWASVFTFRGPLQPLFFTVDKDDVLPADGPK